MPQRRQALSCAKYELTVVGVSRSIVALLEPSQERLALTLAVRGPGEEEELLGVLATQQAAEGVDLCDPHDLLHALATGRPVPVRISLRTSSGSSWTITWAIMPPMENP